MRRIICVTREDVRKEESSLSLPITQNIDPSVSFVVPNIAFSLSESSITPNRSVRQTYRTLLRPFSHHSHTHTMTNTLTTANNFCVHIHRRLWEQREVLLFYKSSHREERRRKKTMMEEQWMERMLWWQETRKRRDMKVGRHKSRKDNEETREERERVTREEEWRLSQNWKKKTLCHRRQLKEKACLFLLYLPSCQRRFVLLLFLTDKKQVWHENLYKFLSTHNRVKKTRTDKWNSRKLKKWRQANKRILKTHPTICLLSKNDERPFKMQFVCVCTWWKTHHFLFVISIHSLPGMKEIKYTSRKKGKNTQLSLPA